MGTWFSFCQIDIIGRANRLRVVGIRARAIHADAEEGYVSGLSCPHEPAPSRYKINFNENLGWPFPTYPRIPRTTYHEPSIFLIDVRMTQFRPI